VQMREELTRLDRPALMQDDGEADFLAEPLVLLSHKNPTWCIFLYINYKV
jgi:hypothetical protein